ncbi:hypothetical protein GCM10027591_12900 [Zhihengliuella somnathii]
MYLYNYADFDSDEAWIPGGLPKGLFCFAWACLLIYVGISLLLHMDDPSKGLFRW